MVSCRLSFAERNRDHVERKIRVIEGNLARDNLRLDSRHDNTNDLFVSGGVSFRGLFESHYISVKTDVVNTRIRLLNNLKVLKGLL